MNKSYKYDLWYNIVALFDSYSRLYLVGKKNHTLWSTKLSKFVIINILESEFLSNI